MDVAGRAGRLRLALGGTGAESLLVTKLSNVRWLTGFTGSNGQLLVTADELIMITDGRYRTQVAAELERSGVEARVEITTTDIARILEAAVPSGARLGLEADAVTWKRHDQIAGWLPGRQLVPLDRPIEELRKDKDDGERSRLARGAAMADSALAEVAPLLGARPTERAVARQLDNLMVELGADGPSYDTIVASGPNSALPHARPTPRVIEAGDLVVIDVGARVDGYGSDMTRTFVAGGEPSAEQLRLYEAVIEAQAAGVAAVAAGVEERSIDETCRSVLERLGLAEAFIHSTGHGIGLEIHEDPILSPRSEGILRSGFVVTVEPGVYLPDLGGVRIEDSVVVREGGCEPISHSPKSLVPPPG
jgi:Xaa-Pro aminopeptidase